jgi:acetylornithine deacetylase/succinyl-diaminopimelate desuccinylase-like protein
MLSQLASAALRSPCGQWRPAPSAAHPDPHRRNAGPRGQGWRSSARPRRAHRCGHEKLVAAIQRHGKRILGVDIPAVGAPLYSDARLYGEHGILIVMYGAGPRTLAESHAKGPDENLLLEDLRRATDVVACTVHDLIAA